MHFLDLCTGWGRLIFKVALHLQQKFSSYEGIDCSPSCKQEFDRLVLSHHYKNKNIDVKFIMRDVLDFQYHKKYALITASWFLGLFNEDTIAQILAYLRKILDKNGCAVIKEQVNVIGCQPNGQDTYFRYSKTKYHAFFKSANFNFQLMHKHEWYDAETQLR